MNETLPKRRRRRPDGLNSAGMYLNFFKGYSLKDPDALHARARSFMKLLVVRHNPIMFQRLANKLKRLRHEAHYSQATWLKTTACGTVACIAGHTLVLCGLSVPSISYLRERKVPLVLLARRALGLSSQEAHSLFGATGYDWPEPYSTRFQRAVYGLGSNEKPSHIVSEMCAAIAKGKVKIPK